MDFGGQPLLKMNNELMIPQLGFGVYLIKDFVLSLTDWEKEIENKSAYGELYVKTWRECRNFVLPMNPQRTELEYAVRNILSSYGVQVKQTRRRRPQKPAAPKTK